MFVADMIRFWLVCSSTDDDSRFFFLSFSKSSNVPELSIHNGKRVRLLSKFNLSLTIRQFGHKTAIPGAEILYGKISNRSKMPPALSGGGGAHT